MDQIKSYLQLIDETLETLFEKKTFLDREAKYLIFAPSKRIRPLLTLATVEMLGFDPKQALYPACAIELIHTYSLIHDDLPCMDNDDMRRGKPSLHKVHDEATALLIGDYLLTYAFEVLAEAPNLTSEKKIALIKTLSLHAGGEGMIGGQLLDWQKFPNKNEVHLKKTGALFISCFQFGGIITGSSKKTMDTLFRLGKTIGLLFQLADDIQDHEGSNDKKEVERLSKQAFTILEPFNSDIIKSLIEKIIFSCMPL